MLPTGNFPQKVFLNGEFMDSEAAKISIFDRGFLFGDGIYEVMVQFERGMFYQQAHMMRLQENLNEIGIRYDVSIMEDEIPHLLQYCQLKDQPCMIYMQVTRGVAPRKHAFPTAATPTALMYALPYSLPEINSKKVHVVSLPDLRWHRCDIKSISLLGNVLANQHAMEQKVDETILVRDGYITEGSHTNIFFVKEGTVYTHPANRHILNGITRKVVIGLCREHNIPLSEKAIGIKDVPSMDEAFLTGTTTQVASVWQFDNHIFHPEVGVGPITKKLQEAFAHLKRLSTNKLKL